MNTDKIFQKNLELWSKTCPRESVLLPYVQTTGLTECTTKKGEPNLKRGKLVYHDSNGAVLEAVEWFEGMSLKEVPLVCIYGVGLGYYYDAIEEWLKKKSSRRLVFLEDDLAVMRKLLETERATRILQNKQVQLIFFRDLKDEGVFQTLYWNFSMTRLAITALTSYSKQKKDLYSELSHKIAYDAARKNALVKEYLDFGAPYYLNFYQNILDLPQSYSGNYFFGKFHNVPAIICGAGPSLAKNLPLVQKLLDRALVFAGGSALNVLNAAGFQPHFGAGVDPNNAQFKRLNENQAYEVPFFYRSRMFHQAFRMIHGPRLYITGAGGYDTADYIEEKLRIKGEWLDEGHNVVNFCVEVANAMGCNPIIFVGMDLAYTEMKGYAPGVVEDSSVSQSTILDVDNEDDKALLKKDVFGKPTYTLWKWVAESDWIGEFAKTHPLLNMVNCTEGGLGFPGISNQKLSEAAEKWLQTRYELKDRIHGEIQNSAFPRVILTKIVKILKELSASLRRTMSHLNILHEETQQEIAKIEEGKDVKQSGRAALAETELVDEPGYKYVVDVFNEVYTRLLTGEVHELSVGRYSPTKKRLKKLALMLRKYTFLENVANINEKLISYAFDQHKKRTKENKVDVESPLQPLLGSERKENFQALMIPKEKTEGQKLEGGHHLRLLYDPEMRLREAFLEKKGQRNGECQLFYSEGTLKQQMFYSKGELHGPATFYDPNGQVLAKSWYDHGIIEGEVFWYYPSGNLYSVQRYKNGAWEGLQEFYHADGKVKTLMTYLKGVLIDKPMVVNADGTLARSFPEETRRQKDKSGKIKRKRK